MAYVEMISLTRNGVADEMSGRLAICLAERAHREGRVEEARGLVELAYRLFDEAADVVCHTAVSRRTELHPA